MTTFQDRETAFEAKFAHDAEMRFRLAARRDRLFAAWLARQRHLSEADHAELLASVFAIHDDAGHDTRLLALAEATFAGSGQAPSGVDMSRALLDCAEQARQQLTFNIQ